MYTFTLLQWLTLLQVQTWHLKRIVVQKEVYIAFGLPSMLSKIILGHEKCKAALYNIVLECTK